MMMRMTFDRIDGKPNRSLANSTKGEKKRDGFWDGTFLENYHYLMSEELIYRCKDSFDESFCSLDDFIVHHVSYQEFDKQYSELFVWCRRMLKMLDEISSNPMIRYVRQKSLEDFYSQGFERLRLLKSYADKLIERFIDLKSVIDEKCMKIDEQWNEFERKIFNSFDEDFHQLEKELQKEFLSFEQWLKEKNDELQNLPLVDFNEQMEKLMSLQKEIQSKTSCVSSLMEICEHLKNDEIDLPLAHAHDLESKWHQLWLESLEMQYLLEDEMKNQSSIVQCDEDDEDVIPFHPSEYEKICLDLDTSSSVIKHHHRSHSLLSMSHSKRHRSSYTLAPSRTYYSLTNIDHLSDVDLDHDQDSISFRYTTTTTGYSSDADFETTTTMPSDVEMEDEQVDSIETISSLRTPHQRMINDSDSDFDDFNYVINESERQLIKARQSFDKKKEQAQPVLSSIDRYQRKYDEILRTCQTNIQCLQTIFDHLHQSRNSRLNCRQAEEQLERYLAAWYDMQEQVEEDRNRARHLLHLSQEIIRLKLRFEHEYSSFTNQFLIDDHLSLSDFKQRLIEHLENVREKFHSIQNDFDLAKEHFHDYFSQHRQEYSSAEKLDEYLHQIERDLPCVMDKIHFEQCQLESTLNLIDEILSLEEIIEEKFHSISDQLHLIENCFETYEQLIPTSSDSISSIISEHCHSKLKIYRENIRKFSQQRHVSFDRSININNNNSSTPPEPFPPKSTTNSFISDDCKVLYIETVIEVPQRVVYERPTIHLDVPTDEEVNLDEIQSECIKPQRRIRRRRPLPRCLPSLFLGLFILVLLFFVYLSHLDQCTRTRILVTTFEYFIRVEPARFPTF